MQSPGCIVVCFSGSYSGWEIAKIMTNAISFNLGRPAKPQPFGPTIVSNAFVSRLVVRTPMLVLEVFGVRRYANVLAAIVQLIAIDVINHFARLERAAKQPCGYRAVQVLVRSFVGFTRRIAASVEVPTRLRQRRIAVVKAGKFPFGEGNPDTHGVSPYWPYCRGVERRVRLRFHAGSYSALAPLRNYILFRGGRKVRLAESSPVTEGA
jgi:hypothetical protein